MVYSIILISVSFFMLYYIYDGYGRVLQLLSYVCPNRSRQVTGESGWPSVTVILPVYNEESRVREKIQDIFCQEYSGELDLIVVSDGSTDQTESIVESFSELPIQLVRTPGRLGKSLAQNLAVEGATGEVLLLTDVAVQMEAGCISNLLKGFFDENVGCVTGALQFRPVDGSIVAEDQGSYWRYEIRLRERESELGLLAVTAGPLMAVRRQLWIPLQSWYGDDCVIPLDVIIQGKIVKHMPEAIGWDESFRSVAQEFSARVRMTVRNWQGTFYRSELLNPFRYPGYTFSLLSHKILRWLSPLWVLGVLVGSIGIAHAGGIDPQNLVFGLLFLSMFLVCLILIAIKGGKVPLLTTLSNFIIVNVAFAIGVLRAITGRSIRVYQNK